MIDSWEATAELGRDDLDALVRSGNAEQRVWAAWRLGLLQDASATALLKEQVVAAPSAGTRRHIAIVLAGAGWTDALQALVDHDPSAYVRRDAAVLWWRCAGELCLSSLERVFETDPAGVMRVGLIEAEPPLPEKLLRELADRATTDPDQAVRLAAARLWCNRCWPLRDNERAAALDDSVEEIRNLLLDRWANEDPVSLLNMTTRIQSRRTATILALLVAKKVRFEWAELEPLVRITGWNESLLALLTRPLDWRALASLLDSQKLDLPLTERAAVSRPSVRQIAPLLQEAHLAGSSSGLQEHHLRQLRNLEKAVQEHDATLEPSGDHFDPWWDAVAEERALLQALGMNPGRIDLFSNDYDD